VTNVIAYNFPHHPNARMAKAIMPSLECVNILKNYFISNMWYGFDVCSTIQTGVRELFQVSLCHIRDLL
jgi:hypothetical protein